MARAAQLERWRATLNRVPLNAAFAEAGDGRAGVVTQDADVAGEVCDL